MAHVRGDEDGADRRREPVSARRLIVLALLVATVMSPAAASAETSGGQVSGNSVSSWVIGAGPGGGVRAPSGSSCSAWDSAANLPAQVGPPDVGTVRQDDAGVIWTLYFRTCGAEVQFVWVPLLDAADIAQLAFDEMLQDLPAPAPRLSPDAGVGGYVHFETWLSVDDPGVVTATSSIPGLSATATARVVRIDWHPGDGALVTCAPFGALPPTPDATGPAPCGHTFTEPSIGSVTGAADDRYHGSVDLVWVASWTATNGESGDLGETTSTTPFVYRVREVQSIGMEG